MTSNSPAANGSGQTPAGVQGSPEQLGTLPLEPGPPGAPRLQSILVFTRAIGYRHESIGAGVEAIRTLGAAHGFGVEQTEDPARFTDEALAAFDVIVFLSTTRDVLGGAQQLALERYIQAGGGWVGVHAAADTEYTWAWYGQLLGGGAYFRSHPRIQNLTVEVEDAVHASTAHLPSSFQLEDEPYNYVVNPRPAVNVLLRLNESSYAPGADAMGEDHPIAWCHEFDGGRAWYTGLGHPVELYTDPRFTQHLLGGIRWAAGVA